MIEKKIEGGKKQIMGLKNRSMLYTESCNSTVTQGMSQMMLMSSLLPASQVTIDEKSYSTNLHIAGGQHITGT